MKGRAARGYRVTPKIREIEDEFNQPFPDVLAGFAADGCNITFTAEVLGFDRASLYRKLQTMRRMGIGIEWPDRYASRRTPDYPNTPAQQAARLVNLTKRDPSNLAPWGNPRKATREMVERAVQMRVEQRLTWRQVARRMGVDDSTLRKARTKYNIADPLGDVFIRAAQHDFTHRDAPRRRP